MTIKEATLEELLKLDLVPSAESLAKLCVSIAASVRANAITDPVLRRLYYAIGVAFSHRQSLLLLNLERQVRIDELPWITPLRAAAVPSTSHRESALETLRFIFRLYITAFPQTMLPNTLIQRLRDLVQEAGIVDELPLVEEIAQDIFCHEFAPKFVRSASIAAKFHEPPRDLYARYL